MFKVKCYSVAGFSYFQLLTFNFQNKRRSRDLFCKLKFKKHTMAKVEYSFPVDKIHGKISKKHKVGFAHRKASAKNYTTSYGERTTPVKSSEIEQRNKFTAVCAAARERLDDPNYINVDQLGFSKQTKYKTIWGYVFKLCWDSYEE